MRDLEHDGLTIFQASWSALADTLERKLAAARRSEAERSPMSDPPTFAIVGAGLAGAKAAEALRAEGFDGNVVLHRRRAPPALRAATAVQGLPAGQRRPRHGLRAPARVVRRPRIDLRVDTTVTAVDRARARARHRRPETGCATTSCC